MAFTSSHQLTKAWADEVISRGERLSPDLSNIILQDCNWHRRDAGSWAVVHAAYLLGAIGGEPAIPVLIHALHRAAEWENDWISEEFPSIAGRIGLKALPYLKEAVLDRTTYWYPRIQALEGMAAVAIHHPEMDSEVFALAAAIAGDVTEDHETRAWAGSILMDFGKKEHEPLLLSLVELGATVGVYDRDEVRDAFAGDPHHCGYDHDWLDFYEPRNVAERREDWEKGRLSEDDALEATAGVEWGTEPDEADEPSEHPPRNSRMVMERMSFHASRAIKEKNLETPEEVNAYLNSQAGKPPQPTAPRNAWEVAQDLLYEAWEEDDSGKRVEMARKALKICPDSADAYNLLADEIADDPKEAIEFYEKALHAGERQLGPNFFKENVGHFWGIVEARPYMRARAELSQCLWHEGERDEAISHWHEMLRLNPHDNQGMRYILATRLGSLGRWRELEKLLERADYKDDCGLDWLVMKALCAFAGEGASSRAEKLLKDAVGQNKFLAEYLLGDKQVPRDLPDRYAIGSEDEAAICAFGVLPAWRNMPKALEWLKGVLGVPVTPNVGRNEPCPCGSGKKFKKCCLGSDSSGRKPAESAPRQDREGSHDAESLRQQIESREKAFESVVRLAVESPSLSQADHDARLAELTKQFGTAAVEQAIKQMRRGTEHENMLNDRSILYRLYRRTFARFGGARRFLRRDELDNLKEERGNLEMRRRGEFGGGPLSPAEEARLIELRDLLLADAVLGEDLMIEAPPPRPATFPSLDKTDHPAPMAALMRLGAEGTVDALIQRGVVSLEHADDLVRVATDDRLLDGWPGERAAWAPMHAIQALERLKATSCAAPILKLLGRPDDWITDLLPEAWSAMGPQAMQVLWPYSQDRGRAPELRGLVFHGLARMAQRQSSVRREVVEGLATILDKGAGDNREAMAYVVFLLGELQAVEASDAIERAFDRGIVDTAICDEDCVRSSLKGEDEE